MELKLIMNGGRTPFVDCEFNGKRFSASAFYNGKNWQMQVIGYKASVWLSSPGTTLANVCSRLISQALRQVGYTAEGEQ
jgi:hypothetical protein